MRFNPSTIMAGVVRDVGLYKHVTECEGQEKMRKRQRHMKPLPLEKVEGREEAVSLVKGK